MLNKTLFVSFILAMAIAFTINSCTESNVINEEQLNKVEYIPTKGNHVNEDNQIKIKIYMEVSCDIPFIDGVDVINWKGKFETKMTEDDFIYYCAPWGSPIDCECDCTVYYTIGPSEEHKVPAGEGIEIYSDPKLPVGVWTPNEPLEDLKEGSSYYLPNLERDVLNLGKIIIPEQVVKFSKHFGGYIFNYVPAT